MLFASPETRLIGFYESLATMLEAGIPLSSVLTHSAGGRLLRDERMADTMVRAIDDGEPLSQAMALYPSVFPAFHMRLVKAGEQSGELPTTLRHLVRLLEDRERARRTVRSRLAYPLFLFHAAIFIPTLPTCVTDGVGAYLEATIPILLGVYAVVLGGYGLWRFLRGRPATRRLVDGLALKIPFIGGIVRRSVMVDVLIVLEGLYKAGEPVDRIFEETAGLARNQVLGEEIRRIARRIREGLSLPEAVGSLPALPPQLQALLANGARAGKLDEMLPRARLIVYEENQRAVDALVKVVPVVIYLMVAGYIAYTIIQFYTGRFAQLNL